DFFIPLLRKNDVSHPKDITDIFSPIRKNNMAKASIEGSFWDLYAKSKDMSLSEALGGSRKTIDVGISIGMKESIDELIQSIEQALEIGYKRIKLKIGPGKDIDIIRVVRRQFPAVPLMVDANSSYTLDDIDHLKQLDAFDLLMIEQPLGHDDIVDHAKLQKELLTPICLDESIHSVDDVRRAVELGSCKIVNVKIGRVGGLTEAKRIHDYCQKNKIDLWCGGMLEAGIGRAHNIALTSLTQFTLPGDTAGSSNYWYEDIITPEVVVTNGEISVPQGRGIGYEINTRVLDRHTVSEKVFTF
ncbi:MAG TPA: o-succinylbenzoate synthase, partial [Bacillota bacterium]|nr:o-succinylbenzoate synthase [Bacillota bacterium]